MFVSIAIKIFFGLISLFVLTRLLGKKSLSEFTPFDFIYSIVMGGLLEETIYDDKIHFGHFLFALVLFGVMIYGAEALIQKAEKFKHWMKGHPSVLILDGKLNIEAIRKNHVELEQLRGMVRQQGCFSLKAVKAAIMEVDGKVSVMPDEEAEDAFTYLLVDEKDIEKESLQSIGRDEAWLRQSLEEEGYSHLDQIYYAEWSEEQGFYVVLYEETISERIRIES